MLRYRLRQWDTGMSYRDIILVLRPLVCYTSYIALCTAVTDHLLAVPSDIGISSPRPPPSPFVGFSSPPPLNESLRQPDGGETRTTPTDSVLWPSPRSEALSFLWDIAENRARASSRTPETSNMGSFFGADPILFPNGSLGSPVWPNIDTFFGSDPIISTPGVGSPRLRNPSPAINETVQPQQTRTTPARTTPWAQERNPQSPSPQRTTQTGDRPSVYPMAPPSNNSVPTPDPPAPDKDIDSEDDNTRYSLTGLGLEALWIFKCQDDRPQKEIPPGAFAVDVQGKQVLFSEIQEDAKELHEALPAMALQSLGVVPLHKSFLNVVVEESSPGSYVPFFKNWRPDQI